MKKLIFFTSLICFMALKSHAVSDPFTKRGENQNESLGEIDKEIVRRLELSIAAANAGDQRCDVPNSESGQSNSMKATLFKNLEANFSKISGITKGQNPIEAFITENKSIKRRTTFLDRSVYNDIISPALSPIITVNGIQISIDKFKSFFSTGHEIYETHGRQKTIGKVFNSGLYESKGTAKSYFKKEDIYSYADSSASMDGIIFWNKLCRAPLQNPESGECDKDAYISCKNGKYELNKDVPFSIAKHITGAWDEALNCNSYVEEKAYKIVQKTNQALNLNSNYFQSCPVSHDACIEIVKKIRSEKNAAYRMETLSPNCAEIKKLERTTVLKYVYGQELKSEKSKPAAATTGKTSVYKKQ